MEGTRNGLGGQEEEPLPRQLSDKQGLAQAKRMTSDKDKEREGKPIQTCKVLLSKLLQ